ncbi:MAG: 4a-hydroxytetrahydrobiopterin dehydratase [Thiohalospira sp.]
MISVIFFFELLRCDFCYSHKNILAMNNWEETKNGLVKVFTFRNFLKAVDFVNDVAKIAEAANHHPDILIHSYNKVTITLFTHDQNAITSKDHDLAKQINDIISE